jgi:sulfofructose kinase
MIHETMEKHWDIFGLGAVAVDDLLFVDRFPQPNEKISVRMRQRQGGGLTATALVAAARLGSRALYCGVLGDDELSRFVIDDFEREGVELAAVSRKIDARPHQSVIVVDAADDSRTIFAYGQGVMLPPAQEIREDWIASSRVAFIDHSVAEAGLRVTELARRFGVPVVADFETVEAPYLEALLAGVDHLIVNVEFARRLTGKQPIGEMLAGLGSHERAATVITAGNEGCWWNALGGPVEHLPALAVKVVDTTGCGDVFHGAYAAAIARGETIRHGLEIATVAAGLKATRPGGRAGIPDLPTVERLLQDQPFQEG